MSSMMSLGSRSIIDRSTGELIPAGQHSLQELANTINGLIERHERDAWEIGRCAAEARAICEDADLAKAQGIEGDNPNQRFGKWLAENFSQHVDTIWRARRLFEVFGERREEVAHIPQSGLYLLAEPKCDDIRESIINTMDEKPRVRDIRDEIKRHTSRTRQQRAGIEPIEPEAGCSVSDLRQLIEAGNRYQTIYADPPWMYGNQGTRAATSNHYNGLSIEALNELPVKDLSAENAHIHLWATNGFLPDAIRLIEAWGFTYKSCFVWVKPQMGLGNYWRVSHEFLLFGLKGKCPFRQHAEKSWSEYPRRNHSAKPEEIRKKIESVSPGPYLELFGRRIVPGWAVWGDQINREDLA